MLRRFSFLIFIAWLLTSITGCVPLNQFSVEQIQNPASVERLTAFQGLQTELTNAANYNGTLRLLVVQGMGITDPGYSTNLVDRVAGNLNLVLVDSTNIIIPEGPYQSTLGIRNFKNGTNRLCAYELTWSPLTAMLKTNTFALDLAARQISSRQLVNNNLKLQLMDESLSDVILYVGKFRPNIQLPITNAIYRIVSDSSTNDPISILTHSLAGYMVIDTLSSMYDSKTSKKIARDYATHVKQIFMMANQMPILNLSDQTGFELNAPSFAEKINQMVQTPSLNLNKPHIQIVAFSDPNDLLSYKLRQSDIQESTPATIKEASNANVPLIFPSNVKVDAFNVTYTVNPWSILGVFSWPPAAHGDWWTDTAVPSFLSFGCKTNN